MEQILTIEEEKKYIAKYFHDAFCASEGMDEFTGEKFTEVYISNFINFDKDFYDIEFKEVATKDGLQDIRSTYEIKSVTDDLYSSLGRSRKFEDTANGAVYDLQEKYRERATLECDLLTTISSNKNKPEYKLNIYFNNFSHNREMFNLRCYLLSTNGTRYEIPMDSLEKEHNSSDYRFSDSASVAISEEAATMLTQKGTKISVRFDKLTINGVVDCFHNEEGRFDDSNFNTKDDRLKYGIKERDKIILISLDKYIEMANVYNETILLQDHVSVFSDEQIDELFDYCQQAETHHKKEVKKVEQNKKKEKEDLQTAKLIKHANDTLEEAISLNVNPNEFDKLELLFTNPMKIKEVKALKDYCEKNNINSNNSEWLFSIGEKYDKEAILEDIKQSRKGFLKKKRTGKVIGLAMLAIACFLFGTCVKKLTEPGYDSFSGLPVLLQILLILGPMVFFVWGRNKLANPEIHYNEATTGFIKDFEKRFPNSQKKTDNGIFRL